MKKITVNKVYFRNLECLNCSYYGNPKYVGEMVLPDGSTIYGKTATDANAAWGIRNYEAYQEQITREIDGETWYTTRERIKDYANVTYHETKSGNIIFDYIQKYTEGSC